MSNQNWQCQEGDPFKSSQPEIDPRFAAAHYGHDLSPTPDCGACPGDGSICTTSCKVAEESPPVALIDIQARLRGTVDDATPYFTCNAVKQDLLDAADRLDLLESEAEQLRMSVHNARIDIDGLLDIVRTLCCMGDRMALPNSENYPSPLSHFSPLMIAARQACVDHGFTEGGLAIDAAMKDQA